MLAGGEGEPLMLLCFVVVVVVFVGGDRYKKQTKNAGANPKSNLH